MLKTFMYFTILTFAIVVVWIGLAIYWNFKPTDTTSDVKVVPIAGSFDFDTIDRLKSRQPITANLDAQFISSPSASLNSTTELEATSSAPLEIQIVPTLEPLSPISTGSGTQL